MVRHVGRRRSPRPTCPQKTDWFRCIPLRRRSSDVPRRYLGRMESDRGRRSRLALYFIRMFAITGFYHRYFSHRSFKTSRAAPICFRRDRRDARCSAARCGGRRIIACIISAPMSPRTFTRRASTVSSGVTSDGSRRSRISAPSCAWCATSPNFPSWCSSIASTCLVPTVLGFALFGLGAFLQRHAPGLHTTGAQMLIWGFFISTVFLGHGTFTINSLAHVFGQAPV